MKEIAIRAILKDRRRGPAGGQTLQRQIDRPEREGFQIRGGEYPTHSVDSAYDGNRAADRERRKQVRFCVEGLNNVRPNASYKLRQLAYGGAVGDTRSESIELISMVLNAVA